MAEILIKNGIIFDGESKEGKKLDILIKKDKIADLGDFSKKRAEKIIDAQGLYIAPGFIDINSDSDHYLTIFTQPSQESLLQQGITTILVGNCGSSLAPLIKGDLVSIRKWTDPNQINIDWQTFGEFLEKLKKLKLGVNVGSLIGHSTLRRGIIGEEFRDLNELEMAQLNYLIEKSLNEGALGVSFGLSYSHSRITPLYEILEIAKLVEKYQGLLAIHLRSEKEGLISAVAEIDDLVTQLEKIPRIEINHLKAYEGLEDDLDQSLKIINDLKEKGVNIYFDVYPYDTTAGPLYLYLPNWAIHGGLELMVRNIREPLIRKRILKDLQKMNYDYSKIIVAEISQFNNLVGKTINDLAKKRGVSGEEMLLEILVFGNGRVTVFDRCLSLSGTYDLLKNPLAIIATNGAGRNYQINPFVLVHPRSFGAIPKFLSLVRKEKILSWSEAIQKITSLPALQMGLKKRGLIKKGYFADLVIFDPEKIDSLADYQNPYQKPLGIEYVFVNGQLVVEKKEFKGILTGQVLTHN